MMKLSNQRLFLTSIVLAACGYAAVATAQTAAPTTSPTTSPNAAPAQMHNRMQMGDTQSMRERFLGTHQERATKRLNNLKSKLKITPAQEGAWTTFAAAMQPPANMGAGVGMGMGMGMGRGMHHDPKMQAEMDKLTTPERIDKMRALRAERMAAMNAEMDKRGAATKTFYVALTSEQKAVFDAIAMHGGRHGGMGGMGGEHGGRGEHGGKGEHGRMGQRG
jgi:periplasmic protein CpxP/Spy